MVYIVCTRLILVVIVVRRKAQGNCDNRNIDTSKWLCFIIDTFLTVRQFILLFFEFLYANQYDIIRTGYISFLYCVYITMTNDDF